MKSIRVLFVLFIAAIIIASCGPSTSNAELSSVNNQLSSTNNELYSANNESRLPNSEVIIGDQVWATENLNVGKFRNGDLILEAKTGKEWERAEANQQPAYCYYEYNAAYGAKYGKLYNWYAVNNPRGLAPEGWHIPSYAEWKTLEKYIGRGAIGVYDSTGIKMKSTSGWKKFDGYGNGSNSSGFSALPGGVCFSGYPFQDLGSYGYWWSSTPDTYTDLREVWCVHLSHGSHNFFYETRIKSNGLSVRILRD